MKRSLDPSSSALQIPPRQAGFMFFCLGIKAKKMVGVIRLRQGYVETRRIELAVKLSHTQA